MWTSKGGNVCVNVCQYGWAMYYFKWIGDNGDTLHKIIFSMIHSDDPYCLNQSTMRYIYAYRKE